MNESGKRVLLVEDDLTLGAILREHLSTDGCAVAHASNGSQGLWRVNRGGWDAVVLHLLLPGVDGLEIVRRARSFARYAPIIVTSACDSAVQRIRSLEMGADDYLTKPFPVQALLTRLSALLRRADAIAQGMRWDHRTIETGDLLLDRTARQASLNGRPLALTPREFDLLRYLALNPERPCSRIELLNRVWGPQHDGFEHTVNTHINRLRRKIEADRRQPTRIVTVWGSGYKFCLPARAADVPT
jgi:two-component system, OmpR family, response regulator